MAILASASLGVDGSTFRAEVRADAAVDAAAEYSLVVQTYDTPMHEGARPVGSIQRVVSGAELVRGVQVSVVELREAGEELPAEGVVLAWIEPGRSRLEDDARTARPGPGTILGSTERVGDEERVRIWLRDPIAV